MYWYLSFLRPPPVSVLAKTGSITITPQVANDLRTEERLEPTEIAYTWQRIHPTTDDSLPLVHLTTFTPPESSYKSVAIPLPTQARNGEKWRIGLFTASADGSTRSNTPLLLDLTEDQPGVIGVWSEGIEITSGIQTAGPVRGIGGSARKKTASASTTGPAKREKGKGKAREDEGPKQSRIRREWSSPDGGDLRIIEQTSFDLDKKIWDSGIALSSWIWRHTDGEGKGAGETSGSPMRARIFTLLRREHLYILELGSGTGLVSIALGKKLEGRTNGQCRIITTDLDSAVPLMEENLELNGFSASLASNTEGSSAIVEARILDWEQPLPTWLRSDEDDNDRCWPDMILAADVTYNTSSFPYLLRRLVALLDPGEGDLGGKKAPLLLLAYKQRDPGERGLWDLLKQEGIGMVKIDVIQGAGEDGPVEIWVGGRDVMS